MRFAISSILVVGSLAFQPAVPKAQQATALYGFLDFEKFSGGGSGKENLDEQWELQQQILRERQGHSTKGTLKKKYDGGAKGTFGGSKAKSKNVAQMDAMYVNEEKGAKKGPTFKMPWD
uniref:Uncharacterized protein n=1 Tax=Grammatophora oceanica TaxID=210454 RepID=A0A7S1VXA1_9STRA|mmetsp:Transcript_9472/g.13853  ORF Transcript_9472/g.13853 Transcript_9472/m.13853 type:complete len:119 (+) Transcript_9472:52-408(+)